LNWAHNRFLLGDGAVAEHPLGTICHINSIDPDNVVTVPCHDDTDFVALRNRMRDYIDQHDANGDKPQ
jgi:hypothetical protein